MFRRDYGLGRIKNDITDVVSQSLLEDKLKFTVMENGLLKLNWVNIKSALAYGGITIAATFILSVGEYVFRAGSIFGIDWHKATDVGAMASLATFVTSMSLVKNLLTTSKGNLLGIVKVIPPTK